MAYVIMEEGPDTGPSSLYTVLEYTLDILFDDKHGFIHGYIPLSTAIQSFTQGHYSSVSVNDLFTLGHDLVAAEQKLWVPGSDQVESIKRLFIEGMSRQILSGSISSFITSNLYDTESAIYAFITSEKIFYTVSLALQKRANEIEFR